MVVTMSTISEVMGSGDSLLLHLASGDTCVLTVHHFRPSYMEQETFGVSRPQTNGEYRTGSERTEYIYNQGLHRTTVLLLLLLLFRDSICRNRNFGYYKPSLLTIDSDLSTPTELFCKQFNQRTISKFPSSTWIT